tara:strand:- start:114 stop:518 length:405 start_codon:yes stop_codon:yes gene_type:complete
MAYITGKKKHVLNVNRDVTIGVAFPLDETNMFKGTTTTHEQTKANLLNLIMTHPGERINLPNYGLGLKHLLFEQNIDKKTLTEKMMNQIKRYIPSVRLNEVSIAQDDNLHAIFVNVSYTYMLDGSTNNIQLNFK